ncbi:MAG TPA: hypothetical protein VF062_14760 [Candidatus Limnocylindrales bacterium]
MLAGTRAKGLRRGDVLLMPVPGGGYGACQVTANDSELLLVHALDWWSAEPPVLADLAGAQPLRLDHHSHSGGLDQVNISVEVPIPAGFRLLGNQDVGADIPNSSNTHSRWRALAGDVSYQRAWDLELPAAAKAGYKSAATKGPVDVDFGVGAVTIGGATRALDLASGDPVAVPDADAGPVRWEALDRLPGCTRLFWRGPDRGLTAALARYPSISGLTWRDAPEQTDLSGSWLNQLELVGKMPQRLRLPARMRHLSLVAGTDLTVDAADNGRWMRLHLETDSADFVMPQGLERIQELLITGNGSLTAAPLADLTELRELTLRWRRPPGELTEAHDLSALQHLHHVHFIDGYGVGADQIPDLPNLSYLEAFGLTRSSANEMKKRYHHTGVEVIVHGAKSDQWIRANLENPFRNWVDDHEKGGAAACKAYAKALRAIESSPDRQLARETLKTLTGTLNKIDAKYELIDTLRREEAWEAFAVLASKANVGQDEAGDWFDEWRDF